jgi:hypothetical protein
MAKAFMIVIALVIGIAGYNAAQRYWMSAMMDRVNDVSSSQKDWLPPAAPVMFDTTQMSPSFYTPGHIPATHP